MEKCLQHAQSHSPDVLFLGGDMVMDSFDVHKERVDSQWATFQNVLKANWSGPIEPCLGNHDVWGWGNYARYQDEPLFGKGRAMEELQMGHPYRSFDQAGWHFVVLDSTHSLEGDGYTARLDDEQFEWLTSDLAQTPEDKPVFVLSHIPILAACPFFDGDNEQTGNWQVPGAWMHIDARRIKDLFHRHKNVKLCASGHIHLQDHVRYNDVEYVCNGAVCGGWWNGSYQECLAGYAMIDLYDDGSFDNRYIAYDL